MKKRHLRIDKRGYVRFEKQPAIIEPTDPQGPRIIAGALFGFLLGVSLSTIGFVSWAVPHVRSKPPRVVYVDAPAPDPVIIPIKQLDVQYEVLPVVDDTDSKPQDKCSMIRVIASRAGSLVKVCD